MCDKSKHLNWTFSIWSKDEFRWKEKKKKGKKEQWKKDEIGRKERKRWCVLVLLGVEKITKNS